MTLHFHRIPVAEVRSEADDAVSIRLDVPMALAEAFAFRPGQHLTLKREINGEEQRRMIDFPRPPIHTLAQLRDDLPLTSEVIYFQSGSYAPIPQSTQAWIIRATGRPCLCSGSRYNACSMPMRFTENQG